MDMPYDIAAIRDAAIEHVVSGADVPEDLEYLQDWLMENCEDDLYQVADGDLAIPLRYLGTRLNDEDLRNAWELEPDAPITEEMRLKFARERLGLMAEDPDFDFCPGVRPFRIERADGQSAILAFGIRGYSFTGIEFEWYGVFADWESVVQRMQGDDYVLVSALDAVSDEDLLAHWR
jgi:hypothetical protein